MAITPVNGTKGNATGVTTITLTYTPTVGNPVLVFLQATAGITSVTCKDNNNNFLTAGPTAVNSVQHLFSFYIPASITGATSFILAWTTSANCGAVLEEYSGNASINAGLPGSSNVGSSATASITVTTDDANDWIVCALADAGNNLTTTVGTQRQNVIAGSAKINLIDNTSVSPGSLTCTATLSSTQWCAVAIELRTTTLGTDEDLWQNQTAPQNPEPVITVWQ